MKAGTSRIWSFGAAGAVLATTAAVALASTTGAEAATGHAASSAGALTLGGTFGTASFNPWLSPDGDNEYEQIEGAVYDSLTHVGDGGRVTPGLAKSWSWVNPRTLLITLRSGVTFSDGTPVTAAAVKANFDYARTAKPAAQQNAYIAELTTKVLSRTELKVTSKVADPDLPTDFAIGGGYIVNPKALKHPAQLATHPAGSGPYVLTSEQPGQKWTFTRRAHYWDASQYPYGKLTIESFATAQSEDDALRSGQIQGAPDTTLQAKSDKAAGLQIQASGPESFDGIWLADRAGKIVPALGNVKVRQAMNYAIDRPAIMQALGNGYGVAGSLVLPPRVPGYTTAANSVYSYNIAKAKQLMAAAGYPNGFTLPVLSTPVADPLVQAIAGMLSQIGVTLQIEDHTTDYLSQAYSGRWAAIVFAWTPIPATQGLEELLSPSGIGNFDHSTDPTVEKLLAEAQQTTGTAQTKALTQLVDYVNNQAWFLQPGYVPNIYATGPHTTCNLGQRALCELYTFRPAS